MNIIKHVKITKNEITDQLEMELVFDDFFNEYTTEVTIADISTLMSYAIEEELTRYKKVKEEQKTLQTPPSSPTLNNKKYSTFKKTEIKAIDINTLSLKELLKAMKKTGILNESFLDDVYRFHNTPYSYTITENKWSSPFSTEGTTTESLLDELFSRGIILESKEEIIQKISKVHQEYQYNFNKL